MVESPVSYESQPQDEDTASYVTTVILKIRQSEKDAEPEFEVAQVIQAKGSVKEMERTLPILKENQFMISFWDESNNLIAETIVDNPLQKRFEVADGSTIESKTVNVPEEFFTIRANYTQPTATVTVSKLVGDKPQIIEAFTVEVNK